MNWWKDNAMTLIVTGVVSLLFAFTVDRCSTYQLKRLEIEKEVKINKAEEGVKLKFGITKEQ